MNSKERFIRTLRFEDCDRPPFMEYEGPWYETLLRWYTEGLPTPKLTRGWEFHYEPIQSDSVGDYFGFERRIQVPVDFGPIPRFVSRLVGETEEYNIIVDEMGVKKMVRKDRESMPQFFEFPVKNRDDWEEMKKRFDPEDPRRYPKTWSEELIEYYESLNLPVGIGEYPYFGIFSTARWFMGPENLLKSFFIDPQLVKDMFNFFADFLIKTSERAVKEMRIDFASTFEDMAYKNGPHISPKMFREFMLPAYKKLVGFFKNHEVDIFMVDSDGDTRLLLPLFIEAGVNCHWPLEAQAGMNVVSLREEFGKKLAFIGNIDKKALISGKKAIEREVKYKVPKIIEEGGYIPSIDHNIPPDVPFENYKHYVQILKKYIFKV